MEYSTIPTVNAISVPTMVCENVWFFSFTRDQQSKPMINAKGRTFIPKTKMSAKMGPVTPAQWMLTFQDMLIAIRIPVTIV